jgi:hypothetical protein
MDRDQLLQWADKLEETASFLLSQANLIRATVRSEDEAAHETAQQYAEKEQEQ